MHNTPAKDQMVFVRLMVICPFAIFPLPPLVPNLWTLLQLLRIASSTLSGVMGR